MTFKKLRKSKGVTQEEIAMNLGIKQSAVSMWESGKSTPETKHLKTLSVLLRTNIETIIDSLNESKK